MARDINRSRSRAGSQDDRAAQELADDTGYDMNRALAAGEIADNELRAAERAMKGIAGAAADAQEAIHAALRAAEHAEEAARWVLEDAKRLMGAARARADRVRALFRTDRPVADEFDGGARAIDQADQGEVRAIESSLRAVDRAMRAASQAHGRRDRTPPDPGCD
ncbi:MAG TPA: hypothetical protein VEW26_09375 [Allosphingosinicella sp.]|nr:hypothetical protein [Allosphingosinicella sp.]